MSPHEFDLLLLAVGALLLVAVGAVRASTKIGVPSLLAYLGLGVALGESGAGIRFDDAQLAQHLGLAALVVILAEGGLSAHWPSTRSAIPVAVSLSTVGVALSTVVTAGALRLLTGMEWRVALILGAIVSSTDAAAIFSTLRGLRLRRSLSSVLEVESGTNDPLVVIAVVALSTVDGDHHIGTIVLHGLLEMGVGLGVGVVLGHLGAAALRNAALPAAGLYPLAVLATTVLAYGVASILAGSGFLAVYVTAITMGRNRLPHQQATRAVVEGLGWLSQIGLFVMLGLLVSPGEIGGALAPAVIASAVLLFVARPVSVLVAAAWALRPAELVFVSWAGLRGAVPIVFATIPVTFEVPGSEGLVEIVFVMIVLLTLVQGPTLPAVARRCGALEGAGLSDLRVESAPLESVSADLLDLRIPVGSRMAGSTIRGLRLPDGALVTLVVRGDRTFVPDDTTILRESDQLLVVATEAVRIRTERRLRAVSRNGELAGWLGDDGAE
ncbi:MAG TPA: potassium/proton antiporter [Mycobacteriales bacterium]|nr:potassium/proton antiporter [Mycobacteriales bacterium]